MRPWDIVMAAATQGGGAAAAPVYDPSAEALFARMSPEPNAARKGVINDLIVALKADDVWDDLDVLYVLAAATAADALLDWKNFGGAAAFNATLVGAPAFAADRGYTNTATSDYVDTPYTPSTAGGVLTQNSAHIAGWSRTSGQSATATSDNGSGLGVNGLAVAYRRSATGTTDFRVNDSTTSSTAAIGDGSGLYVANRPDASNKQLFRNGAQVGTDFAVASVGLFAAALRVNGRNTLSREMAAFSVGASLSAPKQSAYYTALLAYMTAVGAA
jgi:hypothetical protein